MLYKIYYYYAKVYNYLEMFNLEGFYKNNKYYKFRFNKFIIPFRSYITKYIEHIFDIDVLYTNNGKLLLSNKNKSISVPILNVTLFTVTETQDITKFISSTDNNIPLYIIFYTNNIIKQDYGYKLLLLCKYVKNLKFLTAGVVFNTNDIYKLQCIRNDANASIEQHLDSYIHEIISSTPHSSKVLKSRICNINSQSVRNNFFYYIIASIQYIFIKINISQIINIPHPELTINSLVVL